MNQDLPEGAVTYREYELVADNGDVGSIAFTLGDFDADTMACRAAREAGARAYGLVSILGLGRAPRWPVIWMQTDTQLGITVAEEDRDLTEALRLIVARCIGVFFQDIAPLAPELAVLRLGSDVPGDRSVN
jgi:hypothetical protein